LHSVEDGKTWHSLDSMPTDLGNLASRDSMCNLNSSLLSS